MIRTDLIYEIGTLNNAHIQTHTHILHHIVSEQDNGNIIAV